MLLQSVSINDVEAFEGYPVLANPPHYVTLTVLHLALSEQQGVYLGQSLRVLPAFLCEMGFIFLFPFLEQ